jgi:hypothetical protein
MAMIDEGRWDSQPSDAVLDWTSERIIRQHSERPTASRQTGTCAQCRGDACDLLDWAIAWQTGERRPYPAA